MDSKCFGMTLRTSTSPPDFDDVGTGPAYVGTHGVQEVGQIDHMRFFCRVFNDRHAPRLDGGQHNIHRRPHRRFEIDRTPHQTLRLQLDHAVFHRGHIRPERDKPF